MVEYSGVEPLILVACDWIRSKEYIPMSKAPQAVARWRALSRLEITAIAISFLLHTVTAIVSMGHLYIDEHCQILQFLQMRLHPDWHYPFVPMEFPHHMRPWLQPFLYAGVFKVLPLTDPFARATLLRLITGWAGFASLVFLYFQVRRHATDRMLLFLCFGLWFWPYHHARVSAETFATIVLTFTAGLVFSPPGGELRESIFQKPWPSQALIAGLLGLAAVARPQAGIIAVVLCIGMILEGWRRRGLGFAARTLLVLLTAGMAWEDVGVVIDGWGYGVWTFSVWNDFRIKFLERYLD